MEVWKGECMDVFLFARLCTGGVCGAGRRTCEITDGVGFELRFTGDAKPDEVVLSRKALSYFRLTCKKHFFIAASKRDGPGISQTRHPAE